MGNLFKKLCRIAGETVVKYSLISGNDRILVGVSGGKDSLMLLHVLERLRAAAPVDFSFEAVTFDPGFPEFNVAQTAEYCREHHWKHHVVKLDIAAVLAEKGMEASPCVLCSRLRRGKLYGLARKLGCGKLALGQHLDDVVSSMLMSLCRGQGVTTMAPRVQPENPEHPVVIRPLALVPEELIRSCMAEFDFPAAGECRYKELLNSGDRAYFSKLVQDLAQYIPDVRSNIAHSLGKVELKHLLIVPEQNDETD